MPGSVQIFAAAAKDAGKTDGSVAQLNKLMEDGKALAKDLLPFVAARLKDAAKANGALELALKGLNVKLAQSKVGLQIFQEALFDKGVRQGLSFLLEGFNDLMKSGTAVASLLGGIFEGAVKGLTAPFRLLYAAIYDITNLLGFHGRKSFEDMAKYIGVAVGSVTGLVVAIWALKKAWGGLTTLGKLPKAITSVLGGAKDTISGGKGGVGGQRVYVTNMPKGGLGGETMGKGGKLATAAGIAAVASTVAAGLLATVVLPNSGKGQEFSAENVLGKSFAWADVPLNSLQPQMPAIAKNRGYLTGSYNNLQQNAYGQRVDVNLNVNTPLLEATIADASQNVVAKYGDSVR